MGKRSDFERVERDYYPTPEVAVIPLVVHLGKGTKFIEPCGGGGHLIEALESYGLECLDSFDIEPNHERVNKMDALALCAYYEKTKATALITNPPWQKQKSEGEIFNKLLRHWLRYFDGDIWLLFDADWIHTVQSFEFKEYCSLIVSVGRVSWLGNGVSGVDNCAWYKFNKNNAKPTEFCWPIGAHGRKEIKATLDLFDDT